MKKSKFNIKQPLASSLKLFLRPIETIEENAKPTNRKTSFCKQRKHNKN